MEEGKTIEQIGFVAESLLRVYYHNNKSDKITRFFITDKQLILYGYDTVLDSTSSSPGASCKARQF